MTFEMVQSAGGLKVKRVLLALGLLFTLCLSAFAQTNSAGLRYDPDAVVKTIKDGKKMSGFYVKVDTKKKVVFFYTDSKLKRQVGEYNLGEQYWEDWDSSKLDPLKIDYKAFYKKINTSKTSFMRTKDGTKITSAKPATPAKPSTAKAGTSSTSVKPGNSSSSTASGTTSSSSTSNSTGASNTSRTSGTTGTSSTSNTSITSGTTGSSNTSASSSSSRISSTGTSTGTQGTSSQQTPAATPAPTAYVPDAQKVDNLVFTARKHPTVTSYAAIDNAVKKISCPASMTPENAAKRIVASAKTDMEKARALFSWIGYNIVYDYSFKQESYTAAGTWKNRTGVCEGYTLLYIQMAKAVGLNAEYVSGYAKNTADYNPGNPLEKHGWGVVHINGKHVLFDVTWGAVSKLDDPSTFNGDWFDVDPYLFIFSHFPQDLSHSYIADNSMDLGQFYEYFKKLPTAHPGLARLGVDGKELYDFFKVNPDAWMPKCYNELYVDRGVKINKLPLTKTLTGNKTYTFNFTIPKGVAMTFGSQTLTSGKEFSYTPNTTSEADARLNFGSQCGMVYSTEFNLIENWSGKYFKAQNLSKTQFNMADGSKKDNVASGKPKVLVFFDGSKSDTYAFFYTLTIYSSKFNDVDVFFIDASEKTTNKVKDNVKTCAGQAGISQFVALQDASENRALIQKYMTQAGLSSSDLILPVAVFIDSSNKLQYIDAFRAVPDVYTRVEQIAKATGTKSFNTSSFNIPNTNKKELPAMGGGTVNNQASGKPKVLISMPYLCGDKDSERLAKEIMAASAQFRNIDLVITDSKFACDRMSATKQFNSMLKYSLGNSYDQAFADKVFAVSELAIGLDSEEYYWWAAGFHGRIESVAQIFYIDSTNRYRWMDCIPGITVSSIISRVSEIERTVTRQSASASANTNSYGLPYDPNATFNGKQIEFDASSYFNSGILGIPEDNYIYFYIMEQGPYGCYDWKEQCWLWVTHDRIKEAEIDFTKFYSRIDLSKTKLNRDFTGAPLGPQVNEAREEPVPQAQTSAAALNEYGLPYDPDAVHIELPAGKKTLGSYTIMKSAKNPDWVSIQSMITGGWYTYDLKNQCWESARGLNTDALDISLLYEKIDLSKTELMRAKTGIYCGGWKNIAIKYVEAKEDERIAELEKNATKSKITYGRKNSYGLIYDYDYRISRQVMIFMEKGITGSVDENTKMIVFKNKNGDIVGKYDYDQQVWASRKADFSLTDVELAMFYTVIELRATQLNRDYSGTEILR